MFIENVYFLNVDFSGEIEHVIEFFLYSLSFNLNADFQNSYLLPLICSYDKYYKQVEEITTFQDSLFIILLLIDKMYHIYPKYWYI